jgi:HEAT repeat protein
MPTGRRILRLVVVLAVLAGIGWATLRLGEPKFEGRPLSSVLHSAFQNGPLETGNAGVACPAPGDEIQWAQAERALRSLGARALPVLLKMAMARPPTLGVGKLVEKIGETIARDPMRPGLSRLEKHQIAIWGIRLLGPQARPAIPKLIRLLDDTDSEVQWTALACLAGLGPEAEEAVPALLRRLSASKSAGPGSTATRQTAAWIVKPTVWALGEIGSAASPAVPVLQQVTNDFATVALIRIRRGSFQPFFERLRDTSDFTNWFDTVVEVEGLGSNAEPAIPLLLAALECTNEDVRETAVSAIGALHRRPDLCLGPLVGLLNTNTSSRENVLHALSYFGPAAKPLAPEVARCLRDPDPAIRARAAYALGRIQPQAP